MAHRNVPEVDPWVDDQFAPIDTRTAPEGFGAQINKIAEEEGQIAPQIPQPESAPQPAETAPPAPEETAPEVIALENGASATIWQDKKGWHASVNPGNGAGTEIFHERSQKNLLRQVLIGKANASVKIRDLTRENKIAKLAHQAEQADSQPQRPNQDPRELTADELFQLQADFKVDPIKAIRKWFAMEFGFSPSELVQMAQRGQEASATLTEQQHIRNFLSAHPEFLDTDTNGRAIRAYLRANGLPLTKDNLEVAYKEQLASGLLDVAPPQPETETDAPPSPAERPRPARTVQPAETAQPSERIVRTERRPRTPLSFGLTSRETGAAQSPQSGSGSPGEELDDLPDDQIDALFSGVRRLGAQTRR